jgi:Fe-S cluster assembly iron-binding protein IscA
MSLVTLEPGAGQAIRSLLAEAGVQGPIRIAITSSGCCDPSFGLAVDRIREPDLVEEVDGVTFVIDLETHDLVGEVTIGCKEDGFVVTSSKGLSEWDGFAPCRIRTGSA